MMLTLFTLYTTSVPFFSIFFKQVSSLFIEHVMNIYCSLLEFQRYSCTSFLPYDMVIKTQTVKKKMSPMFGPFRILIHFLFLPILSSSHFRKGRSVIMIQGDITVRCYTRIKSKVTVFPHQNGLHII